MEVKLLPFLTSACGGGEGHVHTLTAVTHLIEGWADPRVSVCRRWQPVACGGHLSTVPLCSIVKLGHCRLHFPLKVRYYKILKCRKFMIFVLRLNGAYKVSDFP
jgi:hypothetical protein